MRNNIAIRNILTAFCGVLLFISTALAIVFSAESVFTRAQTDGWSVSLSLRNDLVLKVQTDAAETLTAYVSDGADGRLNEAVLTREENGFFEYHGVTPQLMTNNVVFETEDGQRKTVSVRTYCQSLLAGDTLESQSAAQRAALQTLAADVLNYGAAAQLQQNYRTEDLANNVLTGEQKDVEKRYASLPAPENVASSEGTPSAEGEGVRGAGVRFDNAAGLYFTVVAPQGIEGLALQITKSGTAETLTAFEETDEAGIYKVSYPAVYVAEYDEPLTAQLVKAGEPVGNILTYSMDSYIARKASDAGMGALVKSMYVFAASAREYAAADPTAGIVWGENTMFGFTSTEIYTVTSDADNKKLTVSYTAAEASSWKNIVAPIGAEGAENNHVGLTLASKTDKPISVRVNLLDGSDHLVKEAYVSEGTVSIDDGAMCLVPANGSIDVVIYYEGAPKNIELMIDSTMAHQSPANTLEISGMKFGFKEKAAPSPDEDQGMLIVGETITFTTEYGYTITTNAAENSMTAAYEDISGKGYTNITGTTEIGDNNTFTFNVRNNGAAEAKIRVDIVCPVENGSLQQDGETRNNFCNLSMTATGVIAQGNDYLYGGADWFTVAAGETASITVTFDDAAGATAVRFFIDSSTYDDETTHTGEVVFSDMALYNVA